MSVDRIYSSVLEIQSMFAQNPFLGEEKLRACIENLEASLQANANAQEFVAMGIEMGSTREQLQIWYDEACATLIQMRDIQNERSGVKSRTNQPTVQPRKPTVQPNKPSKS